MPHSKRSGGTLVIPGDSTPATLELCNPGHHVKLLLIVSFIPNEHATVEQLQLVPGIPLSMPVCKTRGILFPPQLTQWTQPVWSVVGSDLTYHYLSGSTAKPSGLSMLVLIQG